MKRFLAFILSVAMVLSLLPATALAAGAEGDAGEASPGVDLSTVENLDAALHFIVRHWHAVSLNGEVGSGTGAYTRIVEGYIVPDGSSGYTYYAKKYDAADEKDQNAFTGYTKIEVGGTYDYITLSPKNASNGVIVIKTNPYMTEAGEAMESFAGFSVSGGQRAVTPDTNTKGSETLTITYSEDVHLAKAHVFYISEVAKVDGSLEGFSDPQQDTRGDGAVYNTQAGLHTDKTASEVKDEDGNSDGRTFDVNLQAWFAGANTASVGLILDASGSMAYTMDALGTDNIIKDANETFKSKWVTGTNIEEGNFLNPTELKNLLNPRNTDNSPLGTTGYSYYIYDGRSNVLEYVPLAFWNGTSKETVTVDNAVNSKIPQNDYLIGYYTFNNGSANHADPTGRDWLLNDVTGNYAKEVEPQTIGNISYGDGTPAINGWPNHGFHMSGNGFDLKGTEKNPSSSGMLLDATPTSGNFTVSFSITKAETDGSDNQPYVELLYIGPKSVTADGTEYFRAIRDGRVDGFEPGNNQNRLRAYQGGGTDKRKVNINNVFSNNAGKQVITFVFNENSDGTITVTTYINGAQTIDSADNALYGETLTLSDYNIIFNGIKDNYDYTSAGAQLDIDDIYVFDTALSADEVSGLYTDYQKNGISPFGNSSTVVAKTSDNSTAIGAINSAFTNAGAGWYYVNFTSNWEENYVNADLQSGKILWGVNSGIKIASDEANNNTDTKYTYAGANAASPVKFFLDSEGRLCCIFASSTGSNQGVSYVYQNPDSSYTKKEVLQRALGVFATKLNDQSPLSQLSAVRFSTLKLHGQYDKLTLLDWTSDSAAAANMLSIQYGQNGTIQGATSENGLTQYNYGLTGGTNTWTGLRAFRDNLANLGDIDDGSISKYIIIFTDGQDTEIDNLVTADPTADISELAQQTRAYQLTKELKDMGYTIFTVLLEAGPVKEGGEKQVMAETFLKALASNDKYFYAADTADELIELFANDILSEITGDLEHYTVQDYIDPRFDIVDADGNVYHLKAGGSVEVEDAEGNAGSYTLGDLIDLEYGIGLAGTRAALKYDRTANMYYLVWKDQTISGAAPGSPRLSVWNATVRLRAKEDFIGGNAVLVSGNAAQQNYVYSGTGYSDANHATGDNPSKGFPRVTVNVKPYVPSLKDGNVVIYKGEDAIAVLRNALKKLTEDEDNPGSAWYYDYLERYVENSSEYKDMDALLKAILEAENTGIEIPYYYLPDGSGTNQTGGEKHTADKLGTLTYTWAKEAADSNDYTLTVSYQPLLDPAHPDDETSEIASRDVNDMVTEDGVYAWNYTYKSTAGDPATEPNQSKAFTIREASGSIKLQMVLTEEALDYLEEHYPDGETVTFKANLIRGYNGKKETVGVFTATYSADTAGGTVDGTLELDDAFEFDDVLDGTGLPIGIYTLEATKDNTIPAGLTFTSIVSIGDGSKGYPAYIDTNGGIHLGDQINNIPDGMTYTDYRDAVATVTVNLAGTGSLTVTKEVTGAAGETDREFNFTVTLTDPNSASGASRSPYDMLPVSVTYDMAENTGDNETENEPDTEIDPDDPDTDESAKTFSLTVSISGALDETFTITVTREDEDNNEGSTDGEDENQDAGEPDDGDSEGDSNSDVNGGNSGEDNDVPGENDGQPGEGSGETGTEEAEGGANDKEETEPEDKDENEDEGESTIANIALYSSLIAVYGGQEPTFPIEFTLKGGESEALENLPAGSYHIEVANSVGKLMAEETVTFEEDGLFTAATIAIDATELASSQLRFPCTFDGTEFDANGRATFTLKSGESYTINGLPEGIKYTVTEQEAGKDGYTTTVTGKNATGTIPDGDTVTVKFVNRRDKALEPGLNVTKEETSEAPRGGYDVGDTITWTITVKNTGNVTLTNVVVEDVLQGVTLYLNGKEVNNPYTVASLAAGKSVTLTAEYTVTARDVSRGRVNNTAIVTGTDASDPSRKVTADDSITADTASNFWAPPPPSKPTTPPELNTSDHFAYIIGTDEGLVEPLGEITRAEVVTIFFRLLKDDVRDLYWSTVNPYPDVNPEDWYNNAISTMTNMGIVNGLPGGTFAPTTSITRAEFVKIAVGFFDYVDSELTSSGFSDVEGNWAERFIDAAAALGLVNGYPDGTFRPSAYISRSEAMAIINRVLGRKPHVDGLYENMIYWPDNMDTSKWYYADVQEATNSHEYEMSLYKYVKCTCELEDCVCVPESTCVICMMEGCDQCEFTYDEVYENWTARLPVRDWAAFERMWSDSHSAPNPGDVMDESVLFDSKN